MKALSIHPYYAHAIVEGYKTIECRTWSTDYRGDLVICSTATKYHGTIPGHALGVVTLVDVVPFKRKHLKPAMMTNQDYSQGLFAWMLADNRLIVPQPVKGKLSLWNYAGKIEYIPLEEWALPDDIGREDAPDEWGEWYHKYWEPIMI